MNFIDRIKNLVGWGTQGENATGPITIGDFLRSSISRKNGQIVNPQTILRHPAVWRGVDLISTSVAKVPFDVFERQADGSRRPASDHDAYQLLKRQPNAMYSRFQLIKCWVVNTLTFGDGYIYIERDPFGRPLGLYLLDSAATSVHAGRTGVTYTTTDANGRRQQLDASQVAHLRGLGNDGMTGLPICQVLSEAFGLGLTLQRYQRAFFENAGRPSVVIKLPPEVNTKEQVEEFRDAWMVKHGGGPETAFAPAMLRPGADLVALESDSAIESLANLREHDLVTIANCLGIVPHRIGAKSVSVSYGSLEQENLSFLQDIDGWIIQAEQELTLKLLRGEERILGTHYIEGMREALVQSDSKTKAELLALYRRNGMMSDDQIARKLNVNREPGTYWVEASLIERSRALEPSEPIPDPETDDRQLSLLLTSSIVGRLTRRAKKSRKLELKLWQEELGQLPGFDTVVELLDVTPIDSLEAEKIAAILWDGKGVAGDGTGVSVRREIKRLLDDLKDLPTNPES